MLLFSTDSAVFTDFSPPSIFHVPPDHEPDKQLTDWLKEQGADGDTIDKVKRKIKLFIGQ